MSSRLKRSLFFVSCVLTISLAVFCVYRISKTPPVVFRAEDLDRIRDDMTERHVENMLGHPPGDYCTDPDLSETFRTYYLERPLPDLDHREWLSDERMIQIMFKDDRVRVKRFYPPILT